MKILKKFLNIGKYIDNTLGYDDYKINDKYSPYCDMFTEVKNYIKTISPGLIKEDPIIEDSFEIPTGL